MQEFSTAPGHLTINLSHLADNYRFFQQQVSPNCVVSAAVKANAYGLGAEQIINTLHNAGCRLFFVATPDEALEVKTLQPDIMVASLGGLSGGGKDIAKLYAAKNIIPVLNTPEEIEHWHSLPTHNNKPLPAILHIDTGMNRLGLSTKECEEIATKRQDWSHLLYIMSHYACADEEGHALNKAQRKRFEKNAALFPGVKKSLGNSSGILRQDETYDMVRPGYALYGGNPTPEIENSMKPVVDLKVRVLQIRQCLKGESIGYGAGHIFDKDTMTATIGFGYADGFFRSMGDKAVLYWKGQPCPVIGRVSMDLVTIDLSHIKEEPPKTGDWIEVLGPHQDIDQLASTITIGYEILTALGPRYRREYIS